MNYYYQDNIATDIERIRRAKSILKMEIDMRSKNEARRLLNMYREIATENLKVPEFRERAEDILHEIGGRWSD